jgi:hypothetical protein
MGNKHNKRLKEEEEEEEEERRSSEERESLLRELSKKDKFQFGLNIFSSNQTRVRNTSIYIVKKYIL